MKNLYMISTGSCDKAAVALGLALKFKEEGLRVSFFKPVGHPPLSGKLDQEAELMREVLDLNIPDETIVPFIAGASYLSGHQPPRAIREQISRAYQEVCRNSDLVIISSTAFPYSASCLGLDAISLCTLFNAMALLVIKVENDYSMDQALLYCDYLTKNNIPMAGNLFNNVPRPLIAKTQGVYRPFLEERNYPFSGIIPARPEITAPTVAEYYHALGGEILAGEKNLDLRVEDILVGAMTIESALSYLRRSANKAVITGGDRADMALAALESDTSALILTGGFYPDIKVISRAEEKNVPVILVHYDTYSALDRLNNINHQIRPNDQNTIAVAKYNIETYCKWHEILETLRAKG